MRTKNQETLDRILKFVNKYYQEYHSSPTINDVAEGVGVARSTTHRYLQELSDRNLIDYSRGILSAPQSAKMKTAYYQKLGCSPDICFLLDYGQKGRRTVFP